MNNMFYPEISTHKSLKLNSAPKNGVLPPLGYVYQWESIVENNGDKVVYTNFLFDDGSQKQYSLNTNINNNLIVPDEVDDFIFTQNDIDSENKLILENNYIISQIGLFIDEAKSSYNIVSLPIYCNETQNIIDFTDVPCTYGGIIKFAQGTVIINYHDDVYNISQATDSTIFDANNGLIQVCHSVNSYFNVRTENVINLKENQLLKIFVNKNDGQVVFVNDEVIDYSKFCVCFINMLGTIYQMGEIIKIGE